MKSLLKAVAVATVITVGFGGASAQAKSTAKNMPAHCKAGTVRTNKVTTVTVKGKKVRVKGCVRFSPPNIVQPSNGSDGAPGVNGNDGAQGPQGSAGSNGADGKNGSDGATGAPGSNGAAGAPGTPGSVGPAGPVGPSPVSYAATSTGNTVLANLGGPIADRLTLVPVDLTLPAGTYVVTLSGQFNSLVAAADPSITSLVQLSLWLDFNDDGVFQWQVGEGSISPNAELPKTANRSATVSGQAVITLAATTHLRVAGMGYNSDQGSARSGEADISGVTLTAVSQ